MSLTQTASDGSSSLSGSDENSAFGPSMAAPCKSFQTANANLDENVDVDVDVTVDANASADYATAARRWRDREGFADRRLNYQCQIIITAATMQRR
ncbi:GD22653 [Drosophila simulans]|uniref:GD22653 n=1 Tax=Drosophila simulans TaxID=7240 RepID=B4Q3L0_DROSI|nr:GD22653 [Drosophila simulans]